eukprot:2690068-Rhodomonas_salina.1
MERRVVPGPPRADELWLPRQEELEHVRLPTRAPTRQPRTPPLSLGSGDNTRRWAGGDLVLLDGDVQREVALRVCTRPPATCQRHPAPSTQHAQHVSSKEHTARAQHAHSRQHARAAGGSERR